MNNDLSFNRQILRDRLNIIVVIYMKEKIQFDNFLAHSNCFLIFIIFSSKSLSTKQFSSNTFIIDLCFLPEILKSILSRIPINEILTITIKI